MKESFSATAFISAVICLLMRILGLVSDFVMLIYIVVAAIAAIVLIFDK